MCSLSHSFRTSCSRWGQAYNYGGAVTGFDITADDQLEYNQWIAEQV